MCPSYCRSAGEALDKEGNVAALLVRSLWPYALTATEFQPKHPRRKFANEAVTWQLWSQSGGWAGVRSYLDQSADRRARRKDPNRVMEIHAMMGAIGEQAGLCWTLEQDAQRFDVARGKISEEHHRLILRAVSESAGHFLIGAAQSVGNLGVRVALLDTEAAAKIHACTTTKRRKPDFSPGSDDTRAWFFLKDSKSVLAKATTGSGNAPLSRIAEVVSSLADDSRYLAMYTRRGMDYHRLRPQSVPQASPKRGSLRSGQGVVTMDLPTVALDPDADAEKVYRMLVSAMEALRVAMRGIRIDLPKAVRAAGIWYHEPSIGSIARHTPASH